jgi:hypothetical protein
LPDLLLHARRSFTTHVAREGNGFFESLSERLELFIVIVGINRDLFDEPIQIVGFPDIAHCLCHA